MTRARYHLLAPLLALALALGLTLQVRSYGSIDDAGPFHANVRKMVERIPVRIGSWEGVEGRIPAAAGKLLKPNTQFCRHYHQDGTGRMATVLLVHCRDSRDMTGHYPPVCYPGHGWTLLGDRHDETVPLWGRDVPFAVYEFSRTEVNRRVDCILYDCFVLPRAGIATEMKQVVDASADYRTRPYGAAQIQVIFDASTPEPERTSALRELLAPLGPVVDSMILRDGGHQP